MIRVAKRDFFEDLASNRCDPKKFWATIRKLKPCSSTISNALHNGSSTATSDSDKANMLNEFLPPVSTQLLCLPPTPTLRLWTISVPTLMTWYLMRLLTSLRKPNSTLHLAWMASQPGCSGPLLTQSHLQLPPCSISLSIVGSCQLSGSSPTLF